MQLARVADFDRVMGLRRGSLDGHAYHQRAAASGDIGQLLEDALTDPSYFPDYARACFNEYSRDEWLTLVLKLTGYSQTRKHRHRTVTGVIATSGVCNHTLVHASPTDGIVFHLVGRHRLGWNMDTGVHAVCGQVFTKGADKFEASLNGDFYKTQHNEWPADEHYPAALVNSVKYNTKLVMPKTRRSICAGCLPHADEFPETRLQKLGPTALPWKRAEYERWQQNAIAAAIEMANTSIAPEVMVQSAWTKAMAYELADLFYGCGHESVAGLLDEASLEDVAENYAKRWKENLASITREQWVSFFAGAFEAMGEDEQLTEETLTDFTYDWISDNLR